MISRQIITFLGILLFLISSSCSSSTDTSSKDDSVLHSSVVDNKPISEMTKEELLQSKPFKSKMRELAPVYARQKVQFKMLCSEWSRCVSNKEKRRFIRKYEDEVGRDFDVDISSIDKAENLFVTHPEEFLKAMELKLQARAARELAEESYQQSYELRYSE